MTIKFSDITGGGIPYGNNAGRPANPGIGKLYSNGEEKRLELFTNTGWQNIVSETPGVVSVSGNYNESIGSATLEITGTNFSTGAIASAIGTNGVEVNANSTTVNSIVSITTVFSGLSAAYEPYDIKVTNTSNLFGLLPDSLYINQSPIWQTSSGSLGTFNEQVSITLSALSATDPESTPVTYALASGSTLPSGVSLNGSTGVISGTLPDIATDTTYSFTVNATDGANTIPRTFSLTSVAQIEVEILVVAGGGGGGSQVGGGGGAGGLIYSSAYNITRGISLPVSVGTGGVGGPWQGAPGGSRPGSYGTNTVFGSWTAFGGGGGGGHGSNDPASGADGLITQSGRPGGSGGGGGANSSNGAAGGATQTSPSGGTGYGFSGGTGFVSNWSGGGGGGSGSAGSNSTSNVGGTGGSGKQYSITGTSLFYAAGGGGCGNLGLDSGAQGGSGIGGNGVGNSGNTSTKYATDGAANTGSGGGGARDTGPAGDGGSGVVVIAYPDTKPAAVISSGLVYNQPTRSGYRVYRFTAGTGTVTF